MKNKFRLTRTLLFALSLSLPLAGCTSGDRRPDSFNEVVIMLDSSGTFKKRQTEAIAKASSLLDSIAETKVRRWEQATDKITIITVDAVPEVIWEGSIRELKAMKQSDWTARFKARTDYEQCTDVEAAFTLATTRLQGDPQFVKKYLWGFTDLIHEPPTGSIRKCKPPAKPSVPSEEFPWTEFQDVSVSIFWIPPDQKLAWQRSATEHGLATSFALYTTSESGQVKISPPPRPTTKFTDAERAADRESYTQGFVAVLKWAGIIVGGFIALLLAFMWIARRVRPSHPTNRVRTNLRVVRPLPLSKVRPNGNPPTSRQPSGQGRR